MVGCVHMDAVDECLSLLLCTYSVPFFFDSPVTGKWKMD